MAVIEWAMLGFMTLTVIGGFYLLATDGGYINSIGDRAFQFIVAVSILSWLLLSVPLTWLGWGLVFIFAWDAIVIVVKAIFWPNSWTSGTWIAFDSVIALVAIFLILTVGVVV